MQYLVNGVDRFFFKTLQQVEMMSVEYYCADVTTVLSRELKQIRF